MRRRTGPLHSRDRPLRRAGVPGLAVVAVAVAWAGAGFADAPTTTAGEGGDATHPASAAAPAPEAAALAYLDGPPPGRTGGFGEVTCNQCHVGSPLNLEPSPLTIRGLPDGYEPGKSYPIEVVVDDPEMGAAGFQLAVRFRGGPDRGRDAGRLEATSPRTRLVRDSTGVSYAQHTRAGTSVLAGRSVSWTVMWHAPGVDAAATAVLHVAANSANGDASPMGDLIYTARRTLSPH